MRSAGPRPEAPFPPRRQPSWKSVTSYRPSCSGRVSSNAAETAAQPPPMPATRWGGAGGMLAGVLPPDARDLEREVRAVQAARKLEAGFDVAGEHPAHDGHRRPGGELIRLGAAEPRRDALSAAVLGDGHHARLTAPPVGERQEPAP